MSILEQLKGWRARWRVEPPDVEEGHRILCRAFAVTFSSQNGKVCFDYLIENYFKPLEFVGTVDLGKLAERNGQQLLMIDVMQKVDEGNHPAAFEPERSIDDGKEMDVRA